MNEAHDNMDSGRHRRRARYSGSHPRKFDQRYKELNAERYPEMQEHIRTKGRTPAGTHVPVLVQEVLGILNPDRGHVVCDCTIGYGGHAIEFLKQIGPSGRLIGFDVDSANLERARHRLMAAGKAFGWEPNISLYRRNYAGVAEILAREGLDGVDILFADVGVSSMQVDDPARGFSYKHPDSPLDMRMDDRIKRSAADLLRTISQAELSRALWELSDEPNHEQISQCIVEQRQFQPIARTRDLILLIFQANGITEKQWQKRTERGALHPAARTFQALRILVNDELSALRHLLRMAPTALRSDGRLGIISFHSGEDRLVKKALHEGYHSGIYAATSPHIIQAGAKEVSDNPRSSSARFRWARRA